MAGGTRPQVFSGGGAVRAQRGVSLGEILAWRAWVADGIWLRSLAMRDCVWTPGVMEANGAPDEGNHLGFHAMRTHEQVLGYLPKPQPWDEAPVKVWRTLNGSRVPRLMYRGPCLVMGAVKLWGQVVEGELGYRAQFARVHALACVVRTRVELKFLHKPEWNPCHREFETTGERIDLLRGIYTPRQTRGS